jgi:hypothetical protein
MARGVQQQTSDPVDQIAVVLSAVKDPNERAALLFDPQGYAAQRGVRLDTAFTDAIRAEVASINQRIYELGQSGGVGLPRIDDPRAIASAQTLTIRPGEVAILPVLAAAAAVVEAAALVVIAVTSVYQATKWRAASPG